MQHGRERIERLDQPAILIGRDYTILAFNDAYRKRYGDSIVPGRDPCHWVSHRYRSPCHTHGEACPIQLAQDQGDASVMHVHHTPQGPEHCRIDLEQVFDDDGELFGYIEVIRPLSREGTLMGNASLLGESASFQRVLALAERVAPTGRAVLLRGETGTGKELLARALHDRSGRTGAFVPVECSGLSETLFESELFGHTRGAFTGAVSRKIGLIEAADGGTLFLDEVGDLPPSQQVKLLRLLDTRTYRQVGDTQVRGVDFRLICATHRPLEEMVETGEFRRDLYHRIAVIPLVLPPLRERREDIGLLADAFLAHGGSRKILAPTARRALESWSWPGNLRELRNRLDRAALLAHGSVIHPDDLDLGAAPAPTSESGPAWPETILTLDEVERRYLVWARDKLPRAELALALGVSERTLYRKLARLDISAQPGERSR